MVVSVTRWEIKPVNRLASGQAVGYAGNAKRYARRGSAVNRSPKVITVVGVNLLFAKIKRQSQQVWVLQVAVYSQGNCQAQR